MEDQIEKNVDNGMEAGVACGAEEFYMILRIMYIRTYVYECLYMHETRLPIMAA